jgi:hypothetical protein
MATTMSPEKAVHVCSYEHEIEGKSENLILKLPPELVRKNVRPWVKKNVRPNVRPKSN